MTPENEAELASLIKSASSNVYIEGGGTRRLGPKLGEGLCTTRLSGIRLYEPGALTLVAGAGTTLAEINALLAGEGQRLAFDPPDLRALLGREGRSTLGGVVAANASGSRRLQVGACRDAVLGLRMVDGTGMVIKTGGRVMKNVTGYDLVKLNAGAMGRLGVLTEVALKVAPIPECELSLILPQPVDPVATMAKALATPFDLSGAALMPSGDVALRFEGFEAALSYRLAALQSRYGFAGKLLEAGESQALWQNIRDAKGFEADELVLRLSLRPSRLAALRKRLPEAETRVMADWGGGLVWLGLTLPAAEARAILQDLRGFCAKEYGHVTVMKAPKTLEDMPYLQPEPAAIAVLSQKIFDSFDPRGLFAPKDLASPPMPQ